MEKRSRVLVCLNTLTDKPSKRFPSTEKTLLILIVDIVIYYIYIISNLISGISPKALFN